MKIIYIAALPDKKRQWDGERNKSGDVKKLLEQIGAKLIIIDLTKNHVLQVLKLFFVLLFKKYDSVFISKPISGASVAVHLVRKLNKKVPIDFYAIGRGILGLSNIKESYLAELNTCRTIIVESQSVQKSFEDLGIHSKYYVIPCVKQDIDLPFVEKTYFDSSAPIKLLFFSRIEEYKGIYDLIDAVKHINETKKKTVFTLDIASKIPDRDTEKMLFSAIANRDDIRFIGTTVNARTLEGYKLIQDYDLHVLPSKYVRECAPGSVIDMFIAGVPTLSSDFPDSYSLMNEANSFFFKQGDCNDLVRVLMWISTNRVELAKKRESSYEERKKYFFSNNLDVFRNIVLGK